MGFIPKPMSDAFTHSWSLVKEEPCSNCGGIDPDGVYECEGCFPSERFEDYLEALDVDWSGVYSSYYLLCPECHRNAEREGVVDDVEADNMKNNYERERETHPSLPPKRSSTSAKNFFSGISSPSRRRTPLSERLASTIPKRGAPSAQLGKATRNF